MKKSRLFRTINACLIPLAMLLAGHQSGAMGASLAAAADVMTSDMVGNTGSICHSDVNTGSGAVCQGTYNFLNSDLSYNGWGQAGYGTLKVFGSSSISLTAAGSGGPWATITGGLAQFRDQWTILGSAGSGTLEIIFDVTATYNNSKPFTDIYGSLSMYNYNLGTTISPTGDYQLPPVGSGSWSATGVFIVPITFGETLDFNVFMDGGSVLYNLSEGGYDFQSSFLNLSNTAVMSSILVKDGSGDILPFSLSTASGAVLFDELASSIVPVPAAFWLFGSGLLGLAGMAKRKKAT